VIDHHIDLGREDTRGIAVGIRVGHEAESVRTTDNKFCDCLLGVVTQALGIAHIDVGRFTVGNQWDQLLLCRLSKKK